MTTKATNPKDVIGIDKIPLHLVPYAMKVLTAIGLFNGACKYGRANYRVGGVRATVYLDAIERHLEGIKNGEDIDPDEGVPHWCGLLASAAIYVDAMAAGTLVDDRMPRPKGFRAWVDKMTAHVPRLRKLHEGEDPRHYTIQDTPEEPAAEVTDFIHRTVAVVVMANPDLDEKSYDEALVEAGLQPKGQPYEGVTHEEDRLGCSFLRGGFWSR